MSRGGPPDPFTLAEYRELLRALTVRYPVTTFEQMARQPLTESVCLIRHDCDNDLVAALRMASLEAELNLCATYFVMLRSELYNLASPKSLRVVKELLDLGHAIGLHFDSSIYEPSEIPDAVSRERAVLAHELGCEVNVVSFHQPPASILSEPNTLECLNAYDLRTWQLDYISDSNCNWRVGNPFEYLDRVRPRRLQVLVHPEWWTDAAMPTSDKWAAMLKNNVERMIASLREREVSYLVEHRCHIEAIAGE